MPRSSNGRRRGASSRRRRFPKSRKQTGRGPRSGAPDPEQVAHVHEVECGHRPHAVVNGYLIWLVLLVGAFALYHWAI